ncbi:HNH endonuclease signature motif containing protein [Microbacterium hominis]|uniref:DUF222 domain-containing protein n=1 Tax=Microbacterium hominis TaxID=162426 RepID=A0A7D4TPV6_9MICO|nr:HNH endonuclease signature motif containing protein [Microbacterium hominis]QKJ20702.1 DUF222 domain-containing protein [Microbacterium hominis]
MESLADALHEVERALGEVVGRAFRSGELRGLDDVALMQVMAGAAGIARLAEAALVAAVGEVQERVDAAPHADRPTTRFGCRSMRELVQRTTRASGRTVGELIRVARAVQQPVSVATGEVLSAAYPALREAAADGVVGVDALAAIVGALDSAVCERGARAAADVELAAAARGDAVGDAPSPNADELRLQAQVWAMYLDQDGAEPREARALRKRGFTIGVCRDGIVPVRGGVLPEVAGQLQRLFDSILNPKGDGPAAPAGPHFIDSAAVVDSAVGVAGDDVPVETRSRAQLQHDALATILGAAARSGELPTIGGAAPTLVVSVDAEGLESGRGHTHLDGCDEPLPLTVARQVACTGAVQRVTADRAGRILSIDISDRVFAAHQRKAISLRDGGCVIPGCHVPAAWCEIHHVIEHAAGGATHTDNGVLLCWYHHRTIDSSGWQVRMRGGVPEVCGPGWWDASSRWRAVTKSPARLSRALRARSPGG